MRIGIIREGKTPPDKRVPLAPVHCAALMGTFPQLTIVAQRSDIRCFPDEAYQKAGVGLVDDVNDCDLILGVKEVPIDMLVPGSTMMFFSHTIKKQPYNRPLLKAIVERDIRLIDYETLTDGQGRRLLGFGRYAGIVGAYNAFIALGRRTGRFDLKPAYRCTGIEEMHRELEKVRLEGERIIVSGGGKVANGVRETLAAAGITEVSVADFLENDHVHPVWANADILDYHERDGAPPASFGDFVRDSASFNCTFGKFTSKADIFISAHFWDGRSGRFFTEEDVKRDDFRIRVIADITCDIKGSVPTTLRASTIADPIYGYGRFSGAEAEAYADDSITVMAVDNLPCEIPTDASTGFGADLAEHIIPLFLGEDPEQVLHRATICQGGVLTPHFSYLQDYLDGQT
jgi:saccharopine dehydrogenase (NAD+, L-lysine forming)